MNLFENVLINLRVIGSLRPHDRLNTTEPLFTIHSPNRYTPVWFARWWASQNRSCDISRIQHTYNTAKSLQMSIDDQKKVGKLSEYIATSMEGLKHMKETYKNDYTIIATIDVICDTY